MDWINFSGFQVIKVSAPTNGNTGRFEFSLLKSTELETQITLMINYWPSSDSPLLNNPVYTLDYNHINHNKSDYMKHDNNNKQSNAV